MQVLVPDNELGSMPSNTKGHVSRQCESVHGFYIPSLCALHSRRSLLRATSRYFALLHATSRYFALQRIILPLQTTLPHHCTGWNVLSCVALMRVRNPSTPIHVVRSRRPFRACRPLPCICAMMSISEGQALVKDSAFAFCPRIIFRRVSRLASEKTSANVAARRRSQTTSLSVPPARAAAYAPRILARLGSVAGKGSTSECAAVWVLCSHYGRRGRYDVRVFSSF